MNKVSNLIEETALNTEGKDVKINNSNLTISKKNEEIEYENKKNDLHIVYLRNRIKKLDKEKNKLNKENQVLKKTIIKLAKKIK